MFLSRGDRDLGVAFQTHPGRQAFVSRSKGIWSSAADAKSKKRKLHRPCDTRWDAWAQLPGRKFGMSYAHYLQYRLPYEQGNQLIIHFKK